MAPMPLTGTIGTTSSLKPDGDLNALHRRSLPEPVISFHLPTIRRKIAQPDKLSRKGAKQGVAKEEQISPLDETNGDGNLSVESSLVLLQSLRQSRLVHLTALLPYLSTRHRTSTKYHPSPPGHPFPGGLDPSTTSHSLIHLGRADVRTGPLVFPKTRFGEVRVEGGASQEIKSATFVKATGKTVAKNETASSGSNSSAPTPASPYIDDEVVKAVSVAAQKDPKLQALLHIAANGKANPEQLRELAVFIQQVSAQLKEKSNSSTSATIAAKPASSSAVPSTLAPSPSLASTSASATAAPIRPIPPPQVELPSYPPIVTVEYRENPSARFILPLWRGCAVERIVKGGERSIKLTMLLPAIGSTAAARAEGNESNFTEGDSTLSKTSPSNPPTHEQLTAAAPKGAETHAVTWMLSGNSEAPLSDGIWHVFGRVSGATTIIDGEVVRHKDSQADEQVVQQFVNKLKMSMSDLSYTPRIKLDQDEVPKDMLDHLTDKFAPRMQTLASKPIVKLKRGDVEEDDIEVVRDTSKRGRVSAIPSAEKRKRTSTGGSNENQIDDSLISVDDGNTSSTLKPKRKRHVAKHNPDGTLKLCQACGTNSTPMWRRGPAGKSTLCNACGAKWKVGRLIVSGDALPPTKEADKGSDTQSITVSPAAASTSLPST